MNVNASRPSMALLLYIFIRTLITQFSVSRFLGFLRKKGLEPQPVEVQVSDLEAWFFNREKEVFQDACSRGVEIRERIVAALLSVKESAEELGEVEVTVDEFNEPYVQSVRTAKNMLAKKIANAASSMELPSIDSFTDMVKAKDLSIRFLRQIDEVALTHGRMVSRYLKTEARALVASLERLRAEVSLLEELIKANESKVNSFKEVKDDIRRIKSLVEGVKDDESVLQDMERDLHSLEDSIQEVHTQVKELEEKKEFQLNTPIKKEIEALENETARLGAELHSQFSKLSRPLQKYSYVAPLGRDRERLISSYLNSPLEALKSDRGLTVREVLLELRVSLEGKRVKVKDPEKVMSRTKELTANLPLTLNRLDNVQSELEGKRRTLNESLIIQHTQLLESLEKAIRLKQVKEKAKEESKSKALEKRRQIETLIPEVEEEIESLLNVKVKVLWETSPT